MPTHVARRLCGGGTRWTLDLDDPYAWLDEPTTCQGTTVVGLPA